MTKRIGRCGQSAVSACTSDGNARSATTKTIQAQSFDISQGPDRGVDAGRLLTSPRHATVLSPAGKTNLDATDGIKLECNRIFLGLDHKRRHHRAGDNNFSPTQSFAESRQHIRDVPHDIYPIAGVGLRIAGAPELSAAPEDSAYDVVRCAAGARRCEIGRASCRERVWVAGVEV